MTAWSEVALRFTTPVRLHPLGQAEPSDGTRVTALTVSRPDPVSVT